MSYKDIQGNLPFRAVQGESEEDRGKDKVKCVKILVTYCKKVEKYFEPRVNKLKSDIMSKYIVLDIIYLMGHLLVTNTISLHFQGTIK